jgi:hypothetical protein
MMRNSSWRDILKINLLTALLIVAPAISLATLDGCAKKDPIYIYPSSPPNTTGGLPLPRQNAPAPVDTGDSAPAPEDTSAASTAPADTTTANASTGATDTTATPAPAEEPASPPADAAPADTNDGLPPIVTPPGGSSDSSASAGYSQSGVFKLYQPSLVAKIPLIGGFLDTTATVNKWQATGVAAFGSDLFITATDKSGLTFFKGTVLKMSAADGSGFTNLGKQWLGLKYQMDPTVKGIAIDAAGNIYANDSTTFLYALSQPAYSVQKFSAGYSDSIDIAVANNSVYVATSGGIKKYDPASLTSGTDFAAGVTPSGGIGADPAGNLYVVTSGAIKKITTDGKVSDLITGISGAIDVAATADKVLVLTADGVKMYDSTGKSINSFGLGDYTNGTAISASGTDLFVSDAGTSYLDTKIVKYSM